MNIQAPSTSPWPRLSALIAARTGLNFPPDRYADLQRGLQSAALEMGFTDDEFTYWLLSTQPTRRQMQVIAGHLTIGETYFFRERRVFEILATQLIPELLAQRRHERALRIWSAACCTGEEPYSLSILMQQCMVGVTGWHVTVLGTDINERFLQKATAGIYGDWSFRDVPDGFREQYFTPENGRYSVLPQIRERVRFAPLNLAEDSFPSLATDTQAMDLIFCRNVLMYFTPAQAAKVVEKLRRALREDGWLVLSSSEGSHALSGSSGFAPVNFPGATFYRKSGRNVATITDTAASSSADSLYLKGAYVQAEEVLVAALLPDTAPEPPQFSLLARTLANQGKLAEALSCCDRWITAEPLDSGARYLRAMILEETGSTDEAQRSLQQAIYLHPDFVLAHFALGNLARGAHRLDEAHRHFDNTLALLNKLRGEEPLPESDGLTAARLKEVVESLFVLENAP